ncbi:uncharacterized protein [Halyomorpha halys]|uniref:uncharacterized protein n=1 Tax=Halyomorpha halys TaxID=286706 RepID=UPI0006D4F4B6|nr:uncharacterized protein LOC106690807 [Halyomorpha halys]
MKLLIISFCFLAVTDSQYRYNISEYLDDAVEEYNLKVLKSGDEYVALDDPLTIGGFLLTRPMLADMSSLERVGSAWMRPLKDAVEVTASFKFGKMHLDGWNLTGPGKNVEKPRISARDNLVEVTFKGRIETTSSWPTAGGPRVVTKSCFATYDASLAGIYSVVLVTRDGVTSLDGWSRGLLQQISEQIDPFLKAVFEKHFDLCRSLKNNGYKWSNN